MSTLAYNGRPWTLRQTRSPSVDSTNFKEKEEPPEYNICNIWDYMGTSTKPVPNLWIADFYGRQYMHLRVSIPTPLCGNRQYYRTLSKVELQDRGGVPIRVSSLFWHRKMK